MNGHTHMAGGLLAGLAAVSVVPGGQVPALLIASALAGPLADIDHPGSMYGRFLPLPGVVLGKEGLQSWAPRMGFHDHQGGRVGRSLPGGKILWHRGPTHSLLVAGLFAAASGLICWGWFPVLAWPVFLGVLLGYLSHLALDLLNIAPISLMWPFSKKTAHLKFPRIRVGSPGEWLVMGGLIAAIALVAAEYGSGLIRLLALAR